MTVGMLLNIPNLLHISDHTSLTQETFLFAAAKIILDILLNYIY